MAKNNSINNNASTFTVDNGFTVTTGATTINTGTGALNISTDASATTIAIGTGGAIKTVTLGSTNSTSATTVQSGSGACSVGSTGTGATTVGNLTGTTTINFGGGNALTLYKTGTWTPTIEGTVAGITTYTTQSGNYIKIGTLVFVQAHIVITAATGTGNAIIGALPFTSANTVSRAAGAMYMSAAGWAWPVTSTTITFSLNPNATTALIVTSGTVAANGIMQMTNAAATFSFSACYVAAS